MSSLLLVSVVDGDSHIRLHVKEMEELQRLTAVQIRDLFIELGRNFITPFDREDIHFLATDLSNVSRNVLHVTKQVRNYNIDCAGGATEIVALQIDNAIGMVAQVLSKLKDIKDLNRLAGVCTTISQIVHECDDLLDTTVATLLEEEKNEIQLIKMMDHYEALQKLLSKIRDVVNVFESIILKYS